MRRRPATESLRRSSDLGLRVLSGTGAVLFGASFIFAVVNPGALETHARQFLVQRVSEELSSPTAIATPTEAEMFEGVAAALAARADSVRLALAGGMTERIEEALSEFCEYDCIDPETVLEVARPYLEEEETRLGRAAGAAMSFARGHYSETVRALVRDLRIFSGVNAALFLAVLLASLFVGRASGPTTVVLWLLLGATIASTIGYVFVQNWFHTILLDEYAGYGYLGWVVLVFIVLMDWVFLKCQLLSHLTRTQGTV